MKKFLLFAAALCFSATMFAQDIFQDDQGLYYEVIYEDDVATTNCQIIACQDENEVYEGEITIPETVFYNGTEYNVTRIDTDAFNGSSIEGKVTIPGTILAVGARAFFAITGIEEVEFLYGEQSLQDENSELNNNMFGSCTNIATVTLDRDIINGHSTACVGAFSYLNTITTVYIGKHVTLIPNYFCRYNSVIPNSIKDIYFYPSTPPTLGSFCFDILPSEHTMWTQAEDLNTYKAETSYTSYFGKENMHAYDGDDPDEPGNENAFQDEQGLWYEIIFDEDGNATENCQMIAPPAQAEGQVYSGNITIPAEVNGYNVTRVSDYAFSGAEISGYLTIPATITNIGLGAFENCVNLTKVIYEYAAEEIYEENSGNGGGGYSFGGCTGVEWVVLNRDMTTGRNNGLNTPFCYNTTVNTVEIGEAVTKIPAFMFRNTSTNCLQWVTCYALEPPTLGYIYTPSDPFDNLNSDAVLYVYNDYISAYEDSDWGAAGFSEILPIEGVEEGISDLKAETSAKVSGIFNVAGQRVNENAKGLLIKDGKKVLVK